MIGFSGNKTKQEQSILYTDEQCPASKNTALFRVKLASKLLNDFAVCA